MSSPSPFLCLQPPLWPGETIIGNVQRLAIVGAGGAMKPVIRAALPITGVAAPWLLPTHLEFLSSTLDSMPDAEVLLNDHTIYPIATAFLEQRVRDVARLAMLGRRPSTGLYFLLGLTHSLSGSNRAAQAFCPECFEYDRRTLGVGYWHRMHQVPYVSRCPEHRCSLLTGSGCCALTTRASYRAKLPGRMCNCRSPFTTLGADIRSARSRAADRRIAALVADVADAPTVAAPRTALGLVYKSRLQERGFGKGRYMETAAATAAFQKHFGVDILSAYASSVFASHGWLAAVMCGIPPVSVVRNLLLVDFLFDGYREFTEVLASAVQVTVEGAPPRRARRVVSKRKPLRSARDRRRAEFRAWLATHVHPSRSRAQTERPGLVQWLRLYDRPWYESAIPNRANVNLAERTATQWRRSAGDRESSASRFVKERYTQLTLPSREPVRITRQQLVSGMKSQQRRSPELDRLIAELVETKAAFQRRMARWVLAQWQVYGSLEDAIQYAHARVRLPMGVLRQIASEFS